MVTLIGGLLLLLLRIVASGWFWTRATAGEGVVERGGRVVTLGLILNLLPALVLGVGGWWTPLVDWTLWLLVVGLGAWRGRGSVGEARVGIRIAALVAVLLAVAGALPLRSEWLAGGWDPGLYQNSAVMIARNASTQAQGGTLYERLTPAERALFSADQGGTFEVFPGVPVRLADGVLPQYFFPMTPVYGAWLYRLGGLPLLCRSAMVAAWLGLLPLLAMLGLLGLGGWKRLVGLLALLLSPLWWYHQAIPTSELPQLLLLTGGVGLYLHAWRQGGGLWGLGALAFTATLNRFGDPALVAVLLGVVALAEALAGRPGAARRVAVIFLGMLAGLLWTLAVLPDTVVRLHAKDGVLWFIGGALLISIIFISIIPLVNWRRWSRLASWVALAGALGLFLLTALLAWDALREPFLALAARIPLVGEALHRYVRLLLYQGAAVWLLGAVGLVVVAWPGAPVPGRLRALVLALTCICGLLLLNPGISPIYPWALRRYLVFLVPLLALLHTCALVGAVGGRSGWRKALTVVVVLLAFAAARRGFVTSRSAAGVGDYAGLAKVLPVFESRFDARDILVVDDARWGTPLLLLAGRDVLNGTPIWRTKSLFERGQYLRAIAAIGSREGRRVVWMTSTDSGVGIYGDALAGLREVAPPVAFTYATVNHSPRASTFETRESRPVFRFWAAENRALPLAEVPRSAASAD